MDRKKLPIGISDYRKLIEEDYYYVDKTDFIRQVIEEGSLITLLPRPRRFGKSLFLSMLSHYYDINQKDKFDKIFGELYIGKHPTPDRNKYLVLALNFSSVASSMERLEESLQDSNDRIRGTKCPSARRRSRRKTTRIKNGRRFIGITVPKC